MKKAITVIIALALTVLGAEYLRSGWGSDNYQEPGGDRWVVGGSLDVASGGELDIESGGSLEIAGTAVTSTAAELNILDGVTATYAELNIMDGVTATTAELNKIDGYTGSSTELNYLDALHASGVTTTELDIMDGVTATTAQINESIYFDGAPPVATLDHTGNCADTETLTIRGRVYEYDTDSTTTGDVDIDVSGSQAAADCATAAATAINSDGSATMQALSLGTGSLALVDLSPAGTTTIAEALGNGALSTTSGFGGDAGGGVHRAYGCTHTVSAAEATTTNDTNGEIAICGLTLTAAPTAFIVQVFDSNGVQQTMANTQWSFVQVNSDVYIFQALETQNGATDFAENDVIKLIAWE